MYSQRNKQRTRNKKLIFIKNQLYKHFILDYRRISVMCLFLKLYPRNTFHLDINDGRPIAVRTKVY